MFGTRRFMDDVPMLGRPVFQSLGQTPVVVTPAPVSVPAPVVVSSPPAPVVVSDQGYTSAQVGTVLVALGVGFLALELTGITHVMGIRKYRR